MYSKCFWKDFKSTFTDERGEEKVKEDTSHLIKRAAHFKSILTAEGFLVGVVAGLIVLAYRVLLEYSGKAMNFVLALGREYPFAAGVWFLSYLRWHVLLDGW